MSGKTPTAKIYYHTQVKTYQLRRMKKNNQAVGGGSQMRSTEEKALIQTPPDVKF